MFLKQKTWNVCCVVLLHFFPVIHFADRMQHLMRNKGQCYGLTGPHSDGLVQANQLMRSYRRTMLQHAAVTGQRPCLQNDATSHPCMLESLQSHRVQSSHVLIFGHVTMSQIDAKKWPMIACTCSPQSPTLLWFAYFVQGPRDWYVQYYILPYFIFLNCLHVFPNCIRPCGQSLMPGPRRTTTSKAYPCREHMAAAVRCTRQAGSMRHRIPPMN